MRQPRIWQIVVRLQEQKLVLPDLNLISLEEGDSMKWAFDFEMPPNTVPGLAFSETRSEASEGPFGPFTMMTVEPPKVAAPAAASADELPRYEHRFRIFVSGFNGDRSPLTYRAVLRELEIGETTNESNDSRLTFESRAIADRAPQQVTVSLKLGSAPYAKGVVAALEVTPERLAIPPGAPVVWDFVVPTNVFGDLTWFPEVIFPGRVSGPFQAITCLVASRGTADPIQLRVVKLIGSGDNGERGSFHYFCRIRSADGVLAVSSSDPAVDDDGILMTPPPGPGDDEVEKVDVENGR